ncbi:hypothetical protein AN958_11485 [Leucoagaricus sp. SymC.cos]|nr:hypothetical protein AN958_11485 [Leucoagaricus sp. SymC.cos]
MPKTSKNAQNASDAKTKHITDFFPRKPSSYQASSSSATRSKNAKQAATKESTTPHTSLPQSRTRSRSENETSINCGVSSASQPARALSPSPSKPMPIASPMQPSTKRLRSQSIAASQSTKQMKRIKNILRESTCEEEKMDLDENSVVYVPLPPLPNVTPSLQVPLSDSKMALSPDIQSSTSLVPSSVSDEKELGSSMPQRKDAVAVREAVDHWRQEALPLSPLTSVNSPVEIRMGPELNSQSPTEVDWDMNTGTSSSVTPPRPATANAYIPTPPSTDGPEDLRPTSPVKALDGNTKAEQIIREIKARAQANSFVEEPSSPISEVSSLDSSDDEDDKAALAMLGLTNLLQIINPVKEKSPVKSRYNFRKAAAKTEISSLPSFSLRRETSSSTLARRKPSTNPFDALLKEKHAIDKKTSMTSADREKRLRELANMDLNGDSDDGEDDLPVIAGPTSGLDDGNPFVNDEQKQQVMDIFKGDKVIDDEEEQLRRLGMVGVALWVNTDLEAMDDITGALPNLEYHGSDSTLRTFAETISYGDRGLVRLFMQSGVLELANYAEGQSVIDYIISLALPYREDDLDLSALRLLPHILRSDTIKTPVLLFERVLATLCSLGAAPSVLEKLGWTIKPELQRSVSNALRSQVVERLVLCITDVARSVSYSLRACNFTDVRLRSDHLHRREIPDIIAALLLVGTEASTPPELLVQISSGIHAICQCLGPEKNVEHDEECAILNMVLRLVQPYSVQNKLHTLSLISNSAGRVTRIARSVAHAMLTNRSALLSVR